MEEGVWRTISGRRVFIKEGQTVTEAMKASGKFDNYTNGLSKQTYDNFIEAKKFMQELYGSKIDLSEIDAENDQTSGFRDIAQISGNKIKVHAKNDVDTNIFVHEIQHYITHKMVTKLIEHPRTKEEDEIIKGFRKQIYKNSGLKANGDNDRIFVSNYAKTNANEFMSEIASEYYKGSKSFVVANGIDFLKKYFDN